MLTTQPRGPSVLARRARRALIYAISQMLATVSVDVPGLRYCEDVPHRLSLRLRHVLPYLKGTGVWQLYADPSPEGLGARVAGLPKQPKARPVQRTAAC